jgi:uncharacterized membrane protein
MNRLKVLLIASMAVNLFAMGAITSFFVTHPIGRSAMGGPPVMDPIRGPLLGPRDVDMALSADGLRIRDVMMPMFRPKIQQTIKALIAARSKVLKVASMPILDRTALDQALTEMEEADDALTRLGQTLLVEMLTTLSDEDRIAVANLAASRLKNMPLPLPLQDQDISRGPPPPLHKP